MNTISKIEYVDALYFLTEECDVYKEFDTHEAYGYKEEHGEDILLTFIQRKTPEHFFKKMYRKLFWHDRKEVTKGLLIPKGLLVSKNKADAMPHTNIPEGTNVSVKWSDVVYLEDVPMRESHTMRSVGVLFAVKNDRIVLRTPKTIRILPRPQKPHAEHATYLVLPLGCIKTIQPCN